MIDEGATNIFENVMVGFNEEEFNITSRKHKFNVMQRSNLPKLMPLIYIESFRVYVLQRSVGFFIRRKDNQYINFRSCIYIVVF